MQILHPFAGSIQEYDQVIADPSRYRPDHCPQCQAGHGLAAHGFYRRTLVDAGFDGFSRGRAIRNSAPLIAAIEQYHTTHGRCPASLLSVNPDYRPGVIGIAGYHYEPNGAAYNLFFEQFNH